MKITIAAKLIQVLTIQVMMIVVMIQAVMKMKTWRMSRLHWQVLFLFFKFSLSDKSILRQLH